MLERDSVRQLAFDIRLHASQQLLARRINAARQRIVEPVQHIRVVIGDATEHHAIGVFEMLQRIGDAGDAAIQQHHQIGALALEPYTQS